MMKKLISQKKKHAEKFQHKSPLEAIHQAARGLYDAKIINATTMREYDDLCIPPVSDLTPRQIKRIRLREKVSQAIFAKYLNASLSTIKQWELGERHPTGTSLKLLNLVEQYGLDGIT